jgi:hypothetical protein
MQSNSDLMTALERLRDSYEQLVEQPVSETDQAILLAVEITLNNARSAQIL